MSHDLSGIAGDTNTHTVDVLHRWVTTLAETSEAGAQFFVLADPDSATIGDTVTVGAESRVIVSMGEGAVAFDDATLVDHAQGSPVYGVGPVDLDSATVVFRIGAPTLIEKPVTVADPTGAAVVVLDPADTADLAPWFRVTYPWDLRATYPDGDVQTLARGIYAIVPSVG